MKKGKMINLVEEVERQIAPAFLVGVNDGSTSPDHVQLMIDELSELAESIDLEVCGREIVKLRKHSAKFFIGSGKAEEISQLCNSLGIEVIIFDDEISPYQQRNWEVLTGLSVIDRTQVILDIFADRAETMEARLQIERARLKYSLPRLARLWTHLGRQKGGSGSGMGGEGEQQIELDRRMISEDIKKVERQLKNVQRHRETQRKQRKRQHVTTAAIVGYTNAGKSSLLNALTDAEVMAEDKLFATLDSSTKPMRLPDNQTLLLTDTVGFVSKLPHLLVESFKSTLEEAVVADFLIHIVDGTSSYYQDQIDVTNEVLEEIGADLKDTLVVFNKVDELTDMDIDLLRHKYHDAVFISAKTGEGFDELIETMAGYVHRTLRFVNLRIPQSDAGVTSRIHKNCQVISTEYEGNDILLEARVSQSVLKTVEQYVSEE